MEQAKRFHQAPPSVSLCGGSATLDPPYGMATQHQVGWNKQSGSTDPLSVASYGGSAALDPPYGTATKHPVGWNKQSGSTNHLRDGMGMMPRPPFRAQRNENPEFIWIPASSLCVKIAGHKNLISTMRLTKEATSSIRHIVNRACADTQIRNTAFGILCSTWIPEVYSGE